MSERDRDQYHVDILVGLAERTIKKLWVIIVLLIVLLVATNAGWIYYESQFSTEYKEVTQDVDTGEGDAIVTGIGDIYGEGSADSEGQNQIP